VPRNKSIHVREKRGWKKAATGENCTGGRDGRISHTASPCVVAGPVLLASSPDVPPLRPSTARRCRGRVSSLAVGALAVHAAVGQPPPLSRSARSSREVAACSRGFFPKGRGRGLFPGRGRGGKAGNGYDFYWVWPNRTRIYGPNQIFYGLKLSGRKVGLLGLDRWKRTRP
jgi:hypothetical protein